MPPSPSASSSAYRNPTVEEDEDDDLDDLDGESYDVAIRVYLTQLTHSTLRCSRLVQQARCSGVQACCTTERQIGHRSIEHRASSG
jgi:DNA-binding transcriptional LysR family regulator